MRTKVNASFESLYGPRCFTGDAQTGPAHPAGAIGRRKLADFPFAKSHGGLSIRVGIASAVVVLGLGIFVNTLPPACRAAGSQDCGLNLASFTGRSGSDESKSAKVPAPAPVAAVAPAATSEPETAVRQPAETPLAAGLIARTFARLEQAGAVIAPQQEIAKRPPPADPAPADKQEAATDTPASREGLPATPTIRTVQTRAVNADGTIAGLDPAPPRPAPADQVVAETVPPRPEAAAAPIAAAPATAAPEPAAPSSSAESKAQPPVNPPPATKSDAEPPAAPAPAPQPAPAPPASVRPAEAPAKLMVVGGEGVNVRSGPTKARGRVFTLAAGQRVTVLKEHRGWMFVSDAKGRRGWIYSRYLHPARG